MQQFIYSPDNAPPKTFLRNSVTSRGCCRAFIVFVLYRALLFVKDRRERNNTISFPFASQDIASWLYAAQSDCLNNIVYQEALGGTRFSVSNAATYWNNAAQFLTWWKNNIERKSKFRTLQRDAVYSGDEAKHRKRATYSRIAIAIAMNIKSHFNRIVKLNNGAVLQMAIPHLSFEYLDETSGASTVVHEAKQVKVVEDADPFWSMCGADSASTGITSLHNSSPTQPYHPQDMTLTGSLGSFGSDLDYSGVMSSPWDTENENADNRPSNSTFGSCVSGMNMLVKSDQCSKQAQPFESLGNDMEMDGIIPEDWGFYDSLLSKEEQYDWTGCSGPSYFSEDVPDMSSTARRPTANSIPTTTSPTSITHTGEETTQLFHKKTQDSSPESTSGAFPTAVPNTDDWSIQLSRMRNGYF